MTWVKYFNIITSTLLTLCYTYQFYYIIHALIVRPREFKDVEPKHRYGVLISARNEEKVIPYLLDTINEQTYPRDLIRIFVVADNCTDETARVSREKGATVYERFNKEKVGKGYALDFLLGSIDKEFGIESFDGYFIFDADNLLDKDFIKEMDKCFSSGHRIVTSYRNSKNYGDNWISAGYALWFIREARFLNNPRFLLNTSCAVSGTGFLVHSDILKKMGGWKYYMLTEDIQFAVDSVTQGEKIAYCHDAMLFDEQPTKFSVAWRQRLRWAKGFLQVIKGYGLKLIKRIFTAHSFSAFDMLMTIAPAFILTVSNVFVNLFSLIYTLIFFRAGTVHVLFDFGLTVFFAYMLLLVVGAFALIREWKNIHTAVFKKILYLFTFPVFMMTYIPISAQALFSKVEWKPIEHTVSVSLDDVKKESGK